MSNLMSTGVPGEKKAGHRGHRSRSQGHTQNHMGKKLKEWSQMINEGENQWERGKRVKEESKKEGM